MAEIASSSNAQLKVCTALHLSDERPCNDVATSVNGLFCAFHSKQCQGLYKGYKKRNAQLDELAANPPPYLKEATVPLANNKFLDINSEEEIKDVEQYLSRQYSLLQRVIRARKLHHSRFFSLNQDYGHQHHLDSLANQKSIVARAIERTVRRLADILYQKRKWFQWVREVQDEDDIHRSKEKERVKQEAVLFQRHWKTLEARKRQQSKKENLRRQEEFLERAYNERIQEDDESWDPIEDVVEEERGKLADLLKFFLWRDDTVLETVATPSLGSEAQGASIHNDIEGAEVVAVDNNVSTLSSDAKEAEALVDKLVGDLAASSINVPSKIRETRSETPFDAPEHQEPLDEHDNATTASSKKSKKKRSKSKKAKSTSQTSEEVSKPPQGAVRALSKQVGPVKQEIDKSRIETREEMRTRLQNEAASKVSFPGKKPSAEANSLHVDNGPLHNDEIEELLYQVSEIKSLLFCRLLLTQASLLPAAHRANSIEDFLSDPSVSSAELRDLCLKMESPSFSDLRDACADLFRGDELDDQNDEAQDTEALDPQIERTNRLLPHKRRRDDAPDFWKPKNEVKEERSEFLRSRFGGLDQKEENESLESGRQGAYVDFGELDDEGQFRVKKIKIKICGRSIWNYPSETAMKRGGWLQFSVIAKDVGLDGAIQLCRSWDEYFELITLAMYKYFPSYKWTNFVDDPFTRQNLHLGFAVFNYYFNARALTSHFQSGSRGSGTRRHQVVEARNFICAHLKRNEPASRRFIQHLAMQTTKIVILVRDGRTGQIVVKPPKEQLWLLRTKSGMGRAAKQQWTIEKFVGEEFFEAIDGMRTWSFGFKDYYDVYLWDKDAGELPYQLRGVMTEYLFKSHRCCKGTDFFSLVAPILRSITDAAGGARPKDAKPGDATMMDRILSDDVAFYYFDQKLRPARELTEEMTYMEDDALEDEVLFPEGTQNGQSKDLISHSKSRDISKQSMFTNPVQALEADIRFSMAQWIQDPYSDMTDPSDLDDEDFDKDLSESEDEGVQTTSPRLEHGQSTLKKNEKLNQNGGLIKSDKFKENTGLLEKPKPGKNVTSVHSEEGSGWHSFTDEEEAQVKAAMMKCVYMDEADRVLTKFTYRSYMREGLNNIERIAHEKEIERLSSWIASEENDTDFDGLLNKSDVEADFFEFIDKQKAAAFKSAWHRADLEPGSLQKYEAAQELIAKNDDFNRYRGISMIRRYRALQWLGILLNDHRRLDRDARIATATMDLFFNPAFLKTEEGAPFRNSLIMRQKERANMLPDRRTHHSTACRPKDFWQEWDQVKKDYRVKKWPEEENNTESLKEREQVVQPDMFPREWQKVIRPKVAKLFKEGILQNLYLDGAGGIAIATHEPGRPDYDLFIDFRDLMDIKPNAGIPNPLVPNSALLKEARNFAARHPGTARFALLRIWSGSHFWPLTASYESRKTLSFIDGQDRLWAFRFIPKDMPYSEWSMSQAARLRLLPFVYATSKYVKQKRELFLVMGEDEEKLRTVVTAVTYAIQTKPWRLELDLWKSFVNVDLDFILGLDERWLD